MKDIINEVIKQAYKKQRKVDVIIRYLRIKYSIKVDKTAISKRIQKGKVKLT